MNHSAQLRLAMEPTQFPSLAYAKGFLLIYGKFLDVDVTPYMEAFEGSEAGVTVDGYSYLQSEPVEETQTRAPIIRRRPERKLLHSGVRNVEFSGPSGPQAAKFAVVSAGISPKQGSAIKLCS